MQGTRITIFALLFTLLTTTLLGPLGAAAQTQPSRIPDGARGGVCQPIDTDELAAPYIFKYGLNGDTLQEDFFSKENPNSYRNQNFRPTRLTGYLAGKDNLFMTKWVQHGEGNWYSWFGMTGDDFHQHYLELRHNYRPIDVSGYNTAKGETRYNVIWEENLAGVDWKIHRDVSRAGMQNLVNDYAKKGYVPVVVEGYIRDGRLNFISIWERGDCRWKMHNDMSREEYQLKLDEYENQLRPVHVDAYVNEGEVRYSAIWYGIDGPAYELRSNRDWYLFQRLFNNYRAEGYVIDTFFAVDDPSGWTRYGGLWAFNTPLPVDETSSLASRVAYHVDRVPGRAGAAVVDLKSGDSIFSHADAPYGTSSTIKIAILYALLRKADAEGIDLDSTFINVGEKYGSNGGNLLNEDSLYLLSYLVQIMIDNSHNWATNRLIDYVGVDQINQELDNLGIKTTRIQRYMTGGGAPSMHGQSDPVGDLMAGYDNFGTPREFAILLQAVYDNDGLLTNDARQRFFDVLGNANKGFASAVLGEGVDSNWNDVIKIYNKAGSNDFADISAGDVAHRPQIDDDFAQRSEAGYLEFDGDNMVIYAVFVDELDVGATNPAGSDAIKCIPYEIAKDYSGLSTGVVPDECAYP